MSSRANLLFMTMIIYDYIYRRFITACDCAILTFIYSRNFTRIFRFITEYATERIRGM